MERYEYEKERDSEREFASDKHPSSEREVKKESSGSGKQEIGDPVSHSQVNPVEPASAPEKRNLTSWEDSLQSLKGELGPQVFAAYIAPLKLAAYNEATAEFLVTAPSRFIRDRVDRTYKGRISELFSLQLGTAGVSVKFAVDPLGADVSWEAKPVIIKKVLAKPSVERTSDDEAPPLGLGTNSKYTFDNFVVGGNNQFCYAAAMRVADAPGMSYNPLFIYGGVGLGKTHLLHAIGNALFAKNPSAKIFYMSSECFTNEVVRSIQHKKMDELKNRMRSIDLLMIDDIQFLRGKVQTQEEFFHTFNALYLAKRQIVITSDKIPQDIPGIEERLQTRFSWGLAADLQPPDFETRVAILKRKAALDSFDLPEDVAHFIAEQINSNVRELEGALTRLHALSSLQGTRITLRNAESALRPILQTKITNVSVDDIKRVVAMHFGIRIAEMISKRRTKNLSFPRHIAMYLCRKHTTCSFPEIGGYFGGRDHSSVIHATNVIKQKLEDNHETRSAVEKIERDLFG